MELHAWIVTIPVGKWNGIGCRTLRNKYPNLVIKNGGEGFIDFKYFGSSIYIRYL